MRPTDAAFDRAVEAWSMLASDRRRGVRSRGHARCRARSRRSSPGARARTMHCRSTARVPDPAREPGEARATISARRARLYGPRARHEPDRHRDRPRVHRLLHQWPHRGPARCRRRTRRPHQQGAGPRLARLLSRSSGRPKRKVSTAFSAMPGSNGSNSGCSMCVGINGDVVPAGERCASTTNRNFQGRQGRGARTHLMSPAMVAAAAVSGHLADVRPLLAGRKV